LTLSLSCKSGVPPLVFTSDRDGNLEIYSVDVDNKTERNLTATPGDEFSPVVSANRKLVAFQSGPEETTSIEVMSINGTERLPLTSGSGKHSSQCWSPRNDRLAYVKALGTERLIFVVEADGTQTMLLTTIPGHEVGGWSPDGKSVLFAVSEDEAQGIYMRNPDGVNEFRLTNTPDYSPIWSPDARHIAFLSTRDGNPEIYVMNADGTDERRLTENASPEDYLSWSPDGGRLLFISEMDGNPEIYVINVDSATQMRLTTNKVRDEGPVWSPDGNKIAFVSSLDGDAEIFVMEKDGSNQVRLTNNDFEDTSPSW